MTPDAVSRLGTWLLESVLPPSHRETIVGDLIEEYRIRARQSPAAAGRWYLGQVYRSIPPALWAAARRGHALTTIAVAVGVYIAAGAVEFLGVALVSTLLGADARPLPVLSAMVGLATMVLGGYFAAAIRSAAATALAVLIFIGVVILMLTMSGSAPRWYQLTFLMAGPAAALAGGRLHARARTRRGRRAA